jgi:hypothetical protein
LAGKARTLGGALWHRTHTAGKRKAGLLQEGEDKEHPAFS